MKNLVYVLPALACPISMVVMMWFMGRRGHDNPKAETAPRSAEQLREEHQRITAELERLDSRRRDAA